MKSFIYNKPIYLLLYSLFLSCSYMGAQVRVVDNKGTISTIPINWTRVTGTTKDIYNTDLGNVGVGIIKPMATFHNAGSTILGAKAGNTTLSSNDNLIYSDYTVFNYSASASGVTLSLPATMVDATAGRLLTITNTGTTNAFDVSFSAGAAVTLPAGYAQSFVWNGTVWTPQSSPVASSVPISGLTAATKNNSIDNTSYAQTWNWSNANAQNPLTMNASSLTTGTLLSLSTPALTDGNALSISGGSTAGGNGSLLKVTGTSSSYVNGAVQFQLSGGHTGAGLYIFDNTLVGNIAKIDASYLTSGKALTITGGSALTSGSLINATASVSASTTKGLLNIANTATPTTGTVATIQANSTSGSGLTVLANGNVGVGTSAPTAALQLQPGTSAAGTAPLKLTSSGTSVLLTTPETGAIEFDGTHLYCTIGTTRYQLDQQNPISGEIKIWAAATAPPGWFICDGSAVSRATYASLFTTIGTTYGTGDGSTTFNLPNLKGRVPVGYDVSQTEFNALNKTGGEKAHTLSIAEMPSHDHGGATSANSAYSPSGYFMTQPTNTFYGLPGSSPYGNGLIGWNSGNGVSMINTSTTHAHTITAQGGNQPHNNLQPYIVLNYIIKY